MDYQLLEWDTNFFGMKVARITDPFMSMEKVASTLAELKLKGFSFIYWPANHEHNEKDINKLGGLLVDLKTTFMIDFDSSPLDESLSTDIVVPYSVSMQLQDLETLAIQSGQFSRFAIDPHFPREKFIMLYKTWMNRSLRREIANEVLVIEETGRVVGMVTLTEKEGRGNIGLIAVDASSRGKKYGETLVRAAQKWFIKNGYKIGQVVTQGNNISAGNLYKKCGYSVEKVEYYYHFWL
jgi:dTDP-4-amino-4,6-dideoxy-D-galactose acyltransferase